MQGKAEKAGRGPRNPEHPPRQGRIHAEASPVRGAYGEVHVRIHHGASGQGLRCRAGGCGRGHLPRKPPEIRIPPRHGGAQEEPRFREPQTREEDHEGARPLRQGPQGQIQLLQGDGGQGRPQSPGQAVRGRQTVREVGDGRHRVPSSVGQGVPVAGTGPVQQVRGRL